MFTVIFADKKTIALFEETKLFYGPLYDPENTVFCEWNKDGECLEETVPELYGILEHRDEWRAIVFDNDKIESVNPFDFTEYRDEGSSFPELSPEKRIRRRNNRLEAYSAAVSNPLVKLTTALCGVQNYGTLIPDGEFEDILSGRKQVYEYMLEKQLELIECDEKASELDMFRRNDLVKFVPPESVDSLISFVKQSDVHGIAELIPETAIVGFIEFIGEDPGLSDPEYTECLIENTQKAKILNNLAESFLIKDKKPAEVICFSPRTFNSKALEQDIKWKKKDERTSSLFSVYNLYNDKLRFILFDMLPEDNRQYRFDVLKMFCFLLILSANGLPFGSVKAGCVYGAEISLNGDVVTELCEKYLGKLVSTRTCLKEIYKRRESETETSIDDITAQKTFDEDISVAVIAPAGGDEKQLRAKYDELGLAGDCPQDENVYWSKQYREISKNLVRYLREPRRAVKNAVSYDLRRNNSINDERSELLNEKQIEDIVFHTEDLERRITECSTAAIFDTKKYLEQTEHANEIVKRGIRRRMTKKTTAAVGLTAAGAYLFGFIPLLFGSTNSDRSFLFSAALTAGALLLFLLSGLLCLFSLRRRLKNVFKSFNGVINGILSEINGSLASFSDYMSCLCNIMRKKSVLKKRESELSKLKKILAYHDMNIKDRIDEVNEMFSRYVDLGRLNIKECVPYENDYTVMCNYNYEMPCDYSRKSIDYLQKGNRITVPVDYVDNVTLKREELYD